MKFSGHETFHLREGWLTKGMRLLKQDPDLFHSKDKYMHDELGVGSNMGKSIRHWLQVTGLSEPAPNATGISHLSELGSTILKNDPYLLDNFTWWILHINLVNNEAAATSWSWFFNTFYQARFDKKSCVEALRRYLRFKQVTIPSYKTLEQDLGCLLSSYSRVVPESSADPEESYDSPFKDLGLMTSFKESAAYQMSIGLKDVPRAALGYCLAKTFEVDNNATVNEVSVHDAAIKQGGPGKCFLMTASDLFALVEEWGGGMKEHISITGLGGNRMISYPIKAPICWVTSHFEKK